MDLTSLTPNQRLAVEADGDLLVEAGAGAGKTKTLVQRCLRLLLQTTNPVQADRLLMVTFTEAAAAEMRRRLREGLEAEAATQPENPRIAEQLALLDAAPMGTIHSFCLRLLREHGWSLGLDPRPTVLDAADAALLARDILDDVLEENLHDQSPDSPGVRQLYALHPGGGGEAVRALIQQLHARARALPRPAPWLRDLRNRWNQANGRPWKHGFHIGLRIWAHATLQFLQGLPADYPNRATLLRALEQITANARSCSDALSAIAGFQQTEAWPSRKAAKFRDPIKWVFEEASFLAGFVGKEGTDPIAEDWNRARPHMVTLCSLTLQLEERLQAAKYERGWLDFQDLEQHAVSLLWDFTTQGPTPLARTLQADYQTVCVDECQDINAVQDLILRAISRDHPNGNRFLVGDVKQSIYRFRLADPSIFLDYASRWRQPASHGRVIPLSDNFRSHEAILAFVNSTFHCLMNPGLGGVTYGPDAFLSMGGRDLRPAHVNAGIPRVNLRLLIKATPGEDADNEDGDEAQNATEPPDDVELEAIAIAQHLQSLKLAGLRILDPNTRIEREAGWGDMTILLRSPSGQSEIYARVFAAHQIPLLATRRSSFDATEIQDLLSLLQLLDNPQQDLPLLAVLRSPLVGFDVNELALLRSEGGAGSLWAALNTWASGLRALDPATPATVTARSEAGKTKATRFLSQFENWRRLARLGSLSRCLETILDDTGFEARILGSEGGSTRHDNLRRLMSLVRRFDRLQGQGLHRFLQLIKEWKRTGQDPDSRPAISDNPAGAVRLMSIHQSKGLEFPITVVAGLGRRLNTRDLHAPVILDERLGLCPRVQESPQHPSYPSIAYWFGRARQRSELVGEELRLLYVACTRARDHLILSGVVAGSRPARQWSHPAIQPAAPASPLELIRASSAMDWIARVLAQLTGRMDWWTTPESSSPCLAWQILSTPAAGPETASITRGADRPNATTPPVDEASTVVTNDEAVRTWSYPFQAATREHAKMSVTALRRRVEEDLQEAAPLPAPRIRDEESDDTSTAMERGLANHAFLQHLDLRVADAGLPALEFERQRLLDSGLMTAGELAQVDLRSIHHFWRGNLGQRVLHNQARQLREWPFTAQFQMDELPELLGQETAREAARALTGEYIVVQGVVDLAFDTGHGWCLVDFKTDRLSTPAEAEERARHYGPQLRLYASAFERVVNQPVTETWLHFLHPGISLQLTRV